MQCSAEDRRGASAAERLAQAGLRTIVLDEKLAWEKPCGGGITYKAYAQYPYLRYNDTPKKLVTETYLSAPRVAAVKMALNQPLLIYSRFDLNNLLLKCAEAAGAEIEKTRERRALNEAAAIGKYELAAAPLTPISV